MKKISILSIFIMLLFLSFRESVHVPLVPVNYGPNESFSFRVHYGFITAGEAQVEMSSNHYLVNNKVCMRATCTGKSSGSFGLIMKIRDSWTTYIDTVSKTSQRSLRNIEEGKYKLEEVVQFDYANKKALVDWIRKDKGKKKVHDEYEISDNLQDIVSGAYYLRVIDYDKLKVGETFEVKSFLEDKIYTLKIRFNGRETIKTSFGKINAIKLAPIMPENGLFEGENSIRVWLSDDKNRLPLKIQADMFVGAVEVDINGYNNLKYPIQFRK